MPRPRSLTHAAIASAALAVIDRDGLAVLSMRAVAAELGRGTMSLYRYVDDREQVEGLVVDLVLNSVDTGPPPDAAWYERLELLAGRLRDAVGAHPAIVPLMLTHRHSSEGSRRWGEALLGALTDAGFAGQRRVIAFRAVLSHVLGALQVEHLGPLLGEGTRVLAELPDGSYPLLAETARAARGVPPQREFRAGLRILLRGLGAEIPIG